jgi:hypothetical protein
MDFFSQNWATENAFPVQKPFSPTCVAGGWEAD